MSTMNLSDWQRHIVSAWNAAARQEREPRGTPAHQPEAEQHHTGAMATQVGGGHYKDMAIQPVEFIHRNGIGFCEGCVIKYVSRWRAKGGVEDLKKARHFIDLLIEMEGQQP